MGIISSVQVDRKKSMKDPPAYEELFGESSGSKAIVDLDEQLETEVEKAVYQARDEFWDLSEALEQGPVNKLDIHHSSHVKAMKALKEQIEEANIEGYQKFFVVLKEEGKLMKQVIEFGEERKIKHYISPYNPLCVVFVLDGNVSPTMTTIKYTILFYLVICFFFKLVDMTR